MSAAVECGSGGGDDSSFGLRIASVFIILVGSTSGALFPVLAKRSSWLNVPKPIFEFVLSESFRSFFIIMGHTALPNTSVQESSYVGRPFRTGKSCLTLLLLFSKIATAFIHLLASGIEELSSPCLSPDWALYVGLSCDLIDKIHFAK